MVPLPRAFARSWALIAFRGVMAILFGASAIVFPGLTLGLLIVLFAAFAFVDGIALVVLGFSTSRGGYDADAFLIAGVLILALAMLAALNPLGATLALLYLIAGWSIVTGIAETLAAFRLRHAIARDWLLGLAGVVSIVAGVIMFGFPEIGAVALLVGIGVYALLVGALLLAFAVRLHRDVAVTGFAT
jgi:uncharacterized membrane protein HdeD (DUF308 family)